MQHLSFNDTWRRRPEPEACRPSFFILSPRASLAADIYALLTKHPRVRPNLVSKPKGNTQAERVRAGETLTFSVDMLRGNHSFERHLAAVRTLNRFYPRLEPGQITGEVGASLFGDPEVPRRMLELCPYSARNFKFIVMLRNPTARSIAVYTMRTLDRGRELDDRAGMAIIELLKVRRERGA